MQWMGIQKDSSCLRWAKLRKKKGKIHLEQLKTVPFSSNVKQLYFSEEKEQPFLVSGLDTYQVLFRPLLFPLRGKGKIAKMLPFQIESQIPYPAQESVISVQFLPNKASFFLPSRSSSETKVHLFATKREHLCSHIDDWLSLGLCPDEVSCSAAAIRRFFSFFLPLQQRALVFHIEQQAASVVYLVDHEISFAHSFSWDSEALHEKEWSRLFSFLLGKIGSDEPTPVFLTGNFTSLPKFKEFLSSQLPAPFYLEQAPSFHEGHPSYDATTLAAYAVPLGLALEGIQNEGRSVQFRQGDFIAESVQKRRKHYLLTLTLSLCCLTGSTALLGKLYLYEKEKKLFRQLEGTFDLFLSSASPVHTRQECQKRLSDLERALKKGKVSYSLAPSHPPVSHLIELLHKAALPSSLNLKQLTYELLSFPSQGNPQSPFSAKVELGVETEGEKDAKILLAFLQNNVPSLDKEKDVFMEEEGAFFRFTFFLTEGSR